MVSGCSIHLIRRDLFGTKYNSQLNGLKPTEKYIDEINNQVLINKRLVAIDPNLSDLLYCVAKIDNKTVKLRYTQNQRRKETKNKKYHGLISSFRETDKVDGRSIMEWETELTKFNRKSLDFAKFKGYIANKNNINSKLLKYYEGYLYRKLRFNGYVNRQKSEARFLKKFRQFFGRPDDVVIGIGDFEQSQHRKFKEPVKGKGFRDMFRRAGYKNTYLVDEHKTSCRCNNCGDIIQDNYVIGGECKTFRKCKNPRPWRKEETIIRHGLLMCQTCQKLWCRDMNASLNILEIMNAVCQGAPRPRYLQRGRISISNTTSVLPTKFNFSP